MIIDKNKKAISNWSINPRICCAFTTSDWNDFESIL